MTLLDIHGLVFKEGEMRICGGAFFFFWCGVAVNKIPCCGDLKPYSVRSF